MKAFDLLLGVVLVVRCAELYAAETAARNQGKDPLFHALTRAIKRHLQTRGPVRIGLGRERVPTGCGANGVHGGNFARA